MQVIPEENKVDQIVEGGCCFCKPKTRYISALITYLLGITVSFLCFIVYPSNNFVFFTSTGTVLGIITTFILATPKKQWVVWRLKSGPSIAAVVTVLIFIAGTVVGIVFKHWLLVFIFIILQWLLSFAYCFIIIDGGWPAIKAAFEIPLQVSGPQKV